MIHLKGCRSENPDHDGPCRNWQSSPIIVQPDGKLRAYARASSHGDALDDKGNLIAWSQANAVRGVLSEPAIGQEFLAVDDGWVTPDAKKATRAVITKAAKAGGAEKKADTGTDLHTWTERVDLGQPVGHVPPEHEPDLMAYEYATRDMNHLVIEEFCVLDEYRIAGTPDRITEYDSEPCPVCALAVYVFDLKSGSVGFPNKMAVQLSVYQRSIRYVQNADGTATRSAFPETCPHRAIILNLPAGSGTAVAYWLDIEKGWRAVQEYIPIVKSWRDDKTLLQRIA